MARSSQSSRTRRQGLAPQSPRFVLQALPLAVALCFCARVVADPINPGTVGLPMGGTVASGTVASQLAADKLTLTQSGTRAIIDWQSFHIGAGKTVEFVQPGASAAVLNRVPASAGMSDIYGTLTANGTVLLMNPNGVLFHQGANINVGSLIATSGTVDQTGFVSGASFAISGATSGSVSNQGAITASGAGLVALVAPSVSNQGSIAAAGGRVALSGADRATITLNGGLFEFAVPAGALGTNATVANAGSLDGASLLLSTGDAANLVSGVINLQGVQRATGAIVVNGNTVVLTSDLNAPTVSGNSGTIQVQPGASIQDAVKIAKTGAPGAGALVEVQAGSYTEARTPSGELVTLNKAGLTLSGQAGAKLVVPDDPTVNGLLVSANNVTVQGLEIAGPINAPYHVYYRTEAGYVTPTNVSRGIVVDRNVTGFAIHNNNIHDVRTGILVNGIGNTGSVSSNTIENTKSGISVQYTDAAGVTIASNLEGPNGNEWGLNLHLNGHLVGSTIVSNSTPIATAPTTAWQQSLLNLSTTNNGWSVQDQGYTASNRTHANVATTGTASAQGSRLTPINTVQGGVDAVVPGGKVSVAAGTYVLSARLNVGKSLTLEGAGEAGTTIDARGISNNYGLNVTANDVTLRDFTLYGPAAFFASAYGIKVSPGGGADARLRNFTISRVTSRGAGKAELDLNGVDGALIEQVTLNGAPVGDDAGSTQGAGLQLTDSANVTVRSSRTLNNAWGGLAIYQANRSYNQRVDNIRIEGSNVFAEANPVYMQDESALQDFGSLSIAGFDYAVRNAANTDSAQYTWLQPTRQRAIDYAVNLPTADASYVQGWNGATTTTSFVVGVGSLQAGGTRAMSVSTALARSAAGAAIDIDAGSYDEAVVVGSPRELRFGDVRLQGLTLQAGAAGSGLGGQVAVQGSGSIRVQAPVRLLSDTTLATAGGDIELSGDVQNAGAAAAALTLNAGSGGTRGDVSMVTGGSEADPLGTLTITARRYTLADTLWVQQYRIDALGDVALSNHTLQATAASGVNTLNTSGNLTGSTVSKGSVEVVSSGDVQANVTSDGATRVQAANIGGSIVSGGSVDLQGTGDVTANVTADGGAKVAGNNISGNIVSGGNVELQGSGNVAAAVSALGAATVSARNVSGTVSANQVSVAATETVDVNVTAGSSAALSGGVIRGSVSAPMLTADSSGSVVLAVDVGRADVKAAGQAQVSGHADSVGVDAPRAVLTGSLGTVENTGQGVIETNGRALPNKTVQAVLDRVRVIPVVVPPPPALQAAPLAPPPATVHASADLDALPPTAAGPSARPARAAGAPARPRQVAVTRGTPGQAAELLRQWRGVEINLDPGR